jgi:hypothetical protein
LCGSVANVQILSPVWLQLVLEADGYQPYLLSPEKGLRALVRKALELAKDPAKTCVDEVCSPHTLCRFIVAVIQFGCGYCSDLFLIASYCALLFFRFIVSLLT